MESIFGKVGRLLFGDVVCMANVYSLRGKNGSVLTANQVVALDRSGVKNMQQLKVKVARYLVINKIISRVQNVLDYMRKHSY